MQVVDAKEKHYMKEIGRLLASMSSVSLGSPEGGGAKSIGLDEIKKMVDGAHYDEPRIVRALDDMVHAGALQKSSFRWVTTPQFTSWLRHLLDS